MKELIELARKIVSPAMLKLYDGSGVGVDMTPLEAYEEMVDRRLREEKALAARSDRTRAHYHMREVLLCETWLLGYKLYQTTLMRETAEHDCREAGCPVGMGCDAEVLADQEAGCRPCREREGRK